MSEESTDLFDDTAQVEEAKAPETVPEVKVEEPVTSKGEASAEPPAANKDGTGNQPEKTISEGQFKAALKHVSDKLEAAEKELSQMKAKPAPDREKDPNGYDQHMRIEISREIMRSTTTDYDEKIKHFQEMAKENPYLNKLVSEHQYPAKHAYEIASKDLEIKELSGMKDSEEWKQFQEWKKSAKTSNPEVTTAKVAPVSSQTVKVPNLNRATAANVKGLAAEADDELFKGAL